MSIPEIDKALTAFKKAHGQPGDFHTINFELTHYSRNSVEAEWDVTYFPRGEKYISGKGVTLDAAWSDLSRKLGISNRVTVSMN